MPYFLRVEIGKGLLINGHVSSEAPLHVGMGLRPCNGVLVSLSMTADNIIMETKGYTNGARESIRERLHNQRIEVCARLLSNADCLPNHLC